MTSRPSLARSIPFIVLLIASVAATALGAWITLSKLGTMTTTLSATTQSATAAVDVYAGQSWIVFGAALAAAGLIGLFSALAVAALRSILAPAAAPSDQAEVADEPAAADEPEDADKPEVLDLIDETPGARVEDAAKQPAAAV